MLAHLEGSALERDENKVVFLTPLVHIGLMQSPQAS